HRLARQHTERRLAAPMAINSLFLIRLKTVETARCGDRASQSLLVAFRLRYGSASTSNCATSTAQDSWISTNWREDYFLESAQANVFPLCRTTNASIRDQSESLHQLTERLRLVELFQDRQERELHAPQFRNK